MTEGMTPAERLRRYEEDEAGYFCDGAENHVWRSYMNLDFSDRSYLNIDRCRDCGAERRFEGKSRIWVASEDTSESASSAER